MAAAREKCAAGKAAAAEEAAKPESVKKAKAATADVIAQAGEAAIAHWTDHRGELMLTQGQAWTYADGFWRAFDDELDHIMRA